MDSNDLYNTLTYELDNYSESDIKHIYDLIFQAWDSHQLLDSADVANLMTDIYLNYALADERIIDCYVIESLSDVIFGY